MSYHIFHLTHKNNSFVLTNVSYIVWCNEIEFEKKISAHASARLMALLSFKFCIVRPMNEKIMRKCVVMMANVNVLCTFILLDLPVNSSAPLLFLSASDSKCAYTLIWLDLFAYMADEFARARCQNTRYIQFGECVCVSAIGDGC